MQVRVAIPNQRLHPESSRDKPKIGNPSTFPNDQGPRPMT